MNDRSQDEGVAEARYYRRLDDGKLQCLVCPRSCALSDGQRGVCYVRARQGNRLVLTSYGRAIGLCVDPIEKKPLNHFYPGSSVLSFGTAGCNLACKFCQNWDMSQSEAADSRAQAASPEQIARTAERLGCRSVAFTYNDPVPFLEYAVDTARWCRELGVKTVAVTAGYISGDGPREEFFAHMDAANVDLKAFSESFYRKLCGGELAPVLDTLRYIRRTTEVWLELTTLVIPGENDTDTELRELSHWVCSELGPETPLHFSAFHPDFRLTDHPATPLVTLRKARDIAREAGLHYVFTGNVHDNAGAATYCRNCGELLIGRDWYNLTDWRLTDDGRCLKCSALCAGRFDGPPEGWGRRRRPVHLDDD